MFFSIAEKGYKKLRLLKKIKVQSWKDRNISQNCTYHSLNQLLHTPQLVWDSCSANYIEKLKKVQLSAARIVTGLPIPLYRITK